MKSTALHLQSPVVKFFLLVFVEMEQSDVEKIFKNVNWPASVYIRIISSRSCYFTFSFVTSARDKALCLTMSSSGRSVIFWMRFIWPFYDFREERL